MTGYAMSPKDNRIGEEGARYCFKSRGEVQIARFLDRNKLTYRYEHPLAVLDKGKTRIWYPDFLLPD